MEEETTNSQYAVEEVINYLQENKDNIESYLIVTIQKDKHSTKSWFTPAGLEGYTLVGKTSIVLDELKDSIRGNTENL